MIPCCEFCNQRCFIQIPEGTPRHIIEAYKPIKIAATCKEGKQFEKELFGYCYEDIIKNIEIDR